MKSKETLIELDRRLTIICSKFDNNNFRLEIMKDLVKWILEKPLSHEKQEIFDRILKIDVDENFRQN